MTSNQQKVTFALLFTFLVIFYVQYISKKILPVINVEPSEGKDSTLCKNYERDFKTQWCRISNLRRDWKSIVRPCLDTMSWLSRRNTSESQHTDPDTSHVSKIDIKPAGEFSHIFIVTRSRQGSLKTIGGDSWRVKINGTASVSAKTFDFGNGTYEIIFLCYEHGIYFVTIHLDYSSCNGVRDPPGDWFQKGNSQGKYQGLDVIGKPEDFLMKQLKATPIKIEVKERRMPTRDNAPACASGCNIIWNGQGRWKRDKWLPYFQADLPKKDRKTSIRSQRSLLVYGDSVNIFFAQSLRHRSNICRKTFNSCSFTYNWIYQVPNVTLAKRQRDNKDFNLTKVIEDFKRTIFVEKYSNQHSVIIVNFGLHFVESTNFSNYKMLIDEFARTVMGTDEYGRKRFSGFIIWKTTTAINKERADFPQLHWRRFFTNYRIQLYNAYAMDVMCHYGIPVIDAYCISESYPFGTGTHAGRSAVKNDIVHYNNEAFYPIEDFIEEYLK